MKDQVPSSIPLGRLLAAQGIIAQIVASYGADYLPLFLRIENAVKEAEQQQDAITRALNIAAKSQEKLNGHRPGKIAGPQSARGI